MSDTYANFRPRKASPKNEHLLARTGEQDHAATVD
jgi:hypothetical protein